MTTLLAPEAGPRARRARAVLGLLAAIAVWGVWNPLPRHGMTLKPERTDSAHYSAVVDRVAAGQSYYQSLDNELRARGYPTGSVFNWRPPTLTLGLAHAPRAMWAALVVLAAGVIGGTLALFHRAAPEVMLLALLAQIGATMGVFTPLGSVLHETWAGVLIGASVLLYAFRWYHAAALLALAALFIRELAAPYVAVCAVLALVNRRWLEAVLLGTGGSLWLVFLWFHAAAASQYIRAEDLVHPTWIQFGGWSFVVATIGFGGWFYFLPGWVAALAGVLLLACPWAPLDAPHVKATTWLYLFTFLVVGQVFNQSWGLLVAPVWAIACGLGALGIIRLFREARRQTLA